MDSKNQIVLVHVAPEKTATIRYRFPSYAIHCEDGSYRRIVKLVFDKAPMILIYNPEKDAEAAIKLLGASFEYDVKTYWRL